MHFKSLALLKQARLIIVNHLINGENRRDYPHKGERISPPSAMMWLDKIGHVDRVQHRLTWSALHSTNHRRIVTLLQSTDGLFKTILITHNNYWHNENFNHGFYISFYCLHIQNILFFLLLLLLSILLLSLLQFLMCTCEQHTYTSSEHFHLEELRRNHARPGQRKFSCPGRESNSRPSKSHHSRETNRKIMAGILSYEPAFDRKIVENFGYVSSV